MSAWNDKKRVRELVLGYQEQSSVVTMVDRDKLKVDITQVKPTGFRPDTPRPDRLRIGVDMGGVCVHKAKQYENNQMDFNAKLNMEGCVEALRLLSNSGHTIVLVSFCGRKRANNTRVMLEDEYPGLFDEVYFVKSTKFKDSIALSRGLDVMIDDRLDVLESMSSVTPIHFIADVPVAMRDSSAKFIEAVDWDDVVKTLVTQRSKKLPISDHRASLCY